MERIKPGFPTLIAEALRLIPLHIHAYLDCDVFTQTNPNFAGLHAYVDSDLGKPYAEVPHVVYPYHMLHRPADDRRVTMFLPRTDLADFCVVHEFGHVLWWNLGQPSLLPDEVSAYAQTDRYERFAEGFAAWVLPDVYPCHPGWEFAEFLDALGA